MVKAHWPKNPFSFKSLSIPAILHRVVYLFWISGIILAFSYLIFFPQALAASNLEHWIGNLGPGILWSYLAVSLIRGFFMIPSSPFVLAGGLLFPTNPLLIVGISMMGILFSAILIYFFSDSIGISNYIRKKYPEKINPIIEKLQQPKAIWLVIAWSMFPLVPTDLICYTAGIARMPFPRMILGLSIGEFPLVLTYVYLGNSLFNWM